ncbi:MAG: mechanosensitive ion channel [Acetobacteraceae bacterium]|nr:mechanosensitive ion channel [Acetobacteraceae bacterium]
MLEMWAKHGPTQAASATTRTGAARRAGPAILFALAVLLGAIRTASAQPAAETAAPAAAHDAISPRQAANTLAVLRDDKRRAELITTLETIAKAAPAAAPASAPSPALTPAEKLAAGPLAATAATPEPAADAKAADPKAADAKAPPAAPAAKAPAKVPVQTIAPDSVGAQLVGRMSVLLSAYAEQLAQSLQSVNDLPLLWRWLVSQVDDPQARAAAFEAGRMLLIVVAGGLLAEWLMRRLLRRFRTMVGAWSPSHAVADAAASETHEAEARQRRFDRILVAFKIVPYLLGRLLIDLVPIAIFVAVGEILLGTVFQTTPQTRLIVVQVVEAYATARIVLAVTAFLVSPVPPRLLPVTEWAAVFLTRWVRRITIIAVSGFALASVGLLFGMYRTAQLAILKLFALVVHLCLVVAVLQAREPVAHRLHARRGATGLWPVLCNRFAAIWHWVAIFWIIAAWLVWAVEVRNGYQRLLSFFGVSIAIVVAARLLAVLILGGLDRTRTVLVQGYTERAGAYYPFLRILVSAIIWVGAGLALLESWGLPVLLWLTAGGLGARVFDAGLTIIAAVLVAITAWETVNTFTARHLEKLSSTSQLARAGRLRTLLPLMRSVLLVAIVLIVGMTALSAIGVNIAPLLAGAGVIGIAVGFGSQKLVQDLITGLFLLLENSMQVGDVVTVANMTGTVEALTIRTIRLRALDGSVHLIPFSSVTTVTNQTRDYSYAVLDVSIGLNEEPGPMEKVLKEVAAEMQADPAWQSIVLEKLDILGVDKLTDAAWIMRVRMKTQPGSRWAVSRELNRRIKMRFDASAIESPFTSHRVLSQQQAAAQPQQEKAA